MNTRTTMRAGGYARSTPLLGLMLAVAVPLMPQPLAGQSDKKTDSAETRTETRRPLPVSVEVRNNAWLDMRVYAVVRGTRWRLGTAHTGRLLKIEIPRHLQAGITPLQLVAYPIGGSGAAVTDVLLVSPGDTVDWAIENHLALSTVFVS